MSEILYFPQNLNDSKGNYPYVLFSARAPKSEGYSSVNISLPIPPSVGVNQGGEYGTIELGQGGAANAAAVIASSGDKVAKLTSILLDKIASKGDGKFKEAGQFASKRIISPNTNTTFKGNSIREWNFSFSLVASSSKETETIKAIRHAFQRYVYAAKGEIGGAVLTYPPVWNIFFNDGTGVENSYYPKIFASYLTSCNVVANPSENGFRKDGSPLEIQIDLTFRETRMLTREDIDALENGSSDRGVNPETGLATI